MTKFIVELCQNHLGNKEILFQMVDEAILNGADYIKIQHIYSKNLVFRPRFENGYEVNNSITTIKRPFIDEYNRLKGLELKNDDVIEFVNYVISKGKIPITTCFTINDIDEIFAQGFKSVKVASYDSTSYAMIDLLTEKFDEVLISLGSSFESEINYTFEKYKTNRKVHFLHAVTIYPTPLELSRLNLFLYYQNKIDEIGFSDHSDVNASPLTASMIAIHMGATYVERHFTISDNKLIKDGPVSINSNHLSQLISFGKMSASEQKKLLAEIYPQWEKLLVENLDFELTNKELLNRDYYKGRFASPRIFGTNDYKLMRFNWEEA